MRDRRACTCATPSCTRNWGELLTGMLCEMADRGSDSAGVAVYGDPTWSPPDTGASRCSTSTRSTDEVARPSATCWTSGRP